MVARERIRDLVEKLSHERRRFSQKYKMGIELSHVPLPPVSAYGSFSKRTFSSLSASPIFSTGATYTWTFPEHCALDEQTNTLVVSQLSSVVFLNGSSMHVVHKIGSGSTSCNGLVIDPTRRLLFVAKSKPERCGGKA